jgi:3-hydroxybutyryl-CoA dehydrogenase
MNGSFDSVSKTLGRVAYPRMQERLGIAGSGAIACGLAATAARHGEVVLWARSSASARRAQASVEKVCGRLSGAVNAQHVRIEQDLAALDTCTAVVEAIAEDLAAKRSLLFELHRHVAADAMIATTTSSLPIQDLAEASGHAHHFVGLHVFNPVPKMRLVELSFPREATAEIRDRARGMCADLDKVPVEVPDIPGFVVNRLLFPYLFSAVELMADTGMTPADVDACMKLGASHPMGPIELLDFVGLDVALAIGEQIGADVPERIRALVAEGATGKKAGRGLYDYAPAPAG